MVAAMITTTTTPALYWSPVNTGQIKDKLLGVKVCIKYTNVDLINRVIGINDKCDFN